MKKINLVVLFLLVVVLTACGKSSSDNNSETKTTNEEASLLDMLSEEQLDYLTQEEQLTEDAIKLMDYESVNWYLLGTGLELYNKSSGVEKFGITYDNSNGVDYINADFGNGKKITLEEVYGIRDKESDMRVEDFMEYEYYIRVVDEDRSIYSMEVPLEGYENTYVDITFKIDDDMVYMQVPILSYHISDDERYTFSIYYDKAAFLSFCENGDYSNDDKLYFGIQYSSVTGKSLVLQIFNNTEHEYSLNDSFEIYRLINGERELLTDYSHNSDDTTTIEKQTWSIYPVNFPSENNLDKGEYIIVFGTDSENSVYGELEFKVE